MRYWQDVDLPGNDISYSKIADLQSCMDHCITTEACHAFTYDSTNRYADNCWIKTELSSFNFNADSAGFISGMLCSHGSIKELIQPDHYPKG